MLLAALALAVAVSSGDPQPSSVAPPPSLEGGVFPATWAVVKSDCVVAPAFRVHEYNPTVVILRQSGCTHYEKPFLYLLIGTDEALLLDTGAPNANLRPAIDALDAGPAGPRRSAAAPARPAHARARRPHRGRRRPGVAPEHPPDRRYARGHRAVLRAQLADGDGEPTTWEAA